MADGKGCKCAARSSYECGCGADWTPQEVIDARRRLAIFESEVPTDMRMLEVHLRGKRLKDQVSILWAAFRAKDRDLKDLESRNSDLCDIVADVIYGGTPAEFAELKAVYERQRGCS